MKISLSFIGKVDFLMSRILLVVTLHPIGFRSHAIAFAELPDKARSLGETDILCDVCNRTLGRTKQIVASSLQAVGGQIVMWRLLGECMKNPAALCCADMTAVSNIF